MAIKEDLQKWLLEALETNSGQATIVRICEHVWRNHEAELRESGNLFYTWQYDIRWAATRLRKRGLLRSAKTSPRGIWELK